MTSRLVAAPLALLAACAWTPPYAPLDSGAPLGVIAGTVLVVGPERPSDVYVLLYDAADPGPPAGLGSPLNFDVIPAESFEQDPLGSWSASYGLTEIPGGSYTLSGLHDTDQDFSPVVDIAGGSTCGDWGGGFVGWVEAEDGTAGPDTVALELGEGELLDGVPVAIQVPIPVEKPAFTILDGSGAPATAPVTVDRTGELRLGATVVGTEYLELAPLQNLDDKQDCAVSFPFVPIVSYDDTGAPVIEGFQPPQVILTQLLSDEEAAAGAEPVRIQGIVNYDVNTLGVQLLFDSSRPAETLELSVSLAQDGRYFVPFSTSPDGDGAVTSLPAGPWAVTVVNAAGQTWTVPNEAGSEETAPELGFVPATQGVVVMLQ